MFFCGKSLVSKGLNSLGSHSFFIFSIIFPVRLVLLLRIEKTLCSGISAIACIKRSKFFWYSWTNSLCLSTISRLTLFSIKDTSTFWNSSTICRLRFSNSSFNSVSRFLSAAEYPSFSPLSIISSMCRSFSSNKSEEVLVIPLIPPGSCIFWGF